MCAIKILIVDDHEKLRNSVRSLLEPHARWEVCGEASDGREAVEKAKLFRPDLILMDIAMPRMDGLAATKIIRQDLPEAKIILVSQNDPALVQRQAGEVHAHGYVAKADLTEKLVSTIQNVLNAHAELSTNQAQDAIWADFKGEMATLMRQTDWSKTKLGATESWSPALRMMVRFLLANNFPQLLWWGPEFSSLYNDAYVPVLGTKHPAALGKPVKEVWGEIWHILQPLIETPFHGGPPTWMEDIQLEINRRGFVEETHFTIGYSPVPDETAAGGIGGVLATVHEITEKVIADRRIVILRDLGARAVEPTTVDEASAIIAETLARHDKDVPFVLVYLLDPEQETYRLAGSAGINVDDSGCPRQGEIRSTTSSGIWPLAETVAKEKIQLVGDLATKLRSVPQGPWSDPPKSAAVVPIHSNIAQHFAGFMVIGVSSRIEFNQNYEDFLQLLATQAGAMIANARADEDERKRAASLAQIDRAKTVFFNNVSHEFRTPLTLMLGPVEELLTKDTALTPEQKENLQVVHRNSLRMLKLVNTLLDFSRIEAGRIEACYELTDASAFTADLAGVFRSAIEAAGLKLRVNCPPIADATYLDREMWEKIVFNLLSNAFKFTFIGGVEVTTKSGETAFQLCVRDTGTGIPQQDLPHLFERFYSVKGARGRSFEGSGIGLALVQELAALHGGSVHVESEFGRGTTFTVTIPYGKQHLPADRISVVPTERATGVRGEIYIQELLRWLPEKRSSLDAAPVESVLSSSDLSASTASQAARERILVADDNADMRGYIQRLLQGQYDVSVVADGEAALQSARNQRPHLILADVMMPHRDGFGLLEAIRSDESLKDVPVILLSARAGEESRIEGLSFGADDYLIKPFSARELLARVKSHLMIAQVRGKAATLERDLRIEAETVASIVASSDDAIIGKNLDGVITSWNKGAEKIFGYSAAEAIGQRITLIIPPDRLNEEVEIIDRLRRSEHVDHFETVRLHKDDTPLDISLTVSPIRDSSGRVVGASKVVRDITANRKAAAALQEQRERFDLVSKATEIGLWFCDLPFDKLKWDSQVKEHFWLPPEAEVTVEDFYARLHPDDRERIRHAISESVERNASYDVEYRTVSPENGREKWIHAIGRAFYDPAGKPIRFDGLTLDITKIKRTEENYRKLVETLDAEVRARTLELEDRNRDVLRQAEQVRDLSWRLLRTQDDERRHIARELHDSAGQTLTVLGMEVAQLLRKAGAGAPEFASDLEITQKTVQQLQNEIRTASYLLHPPLLDETGLASALSWYVQGLAERSDLDVELHVPEDLGRLPRDLELAIFRLVQECLTNVHRHSGSKTASIRIVREANLLTVGVRDDGKGMPPARLAEIQTQNAGVGIVGMRERLRQFRGNLTIESNGSGTSVLATIPIPKSSQQTESDREPLKTAV